MMKGVRIFAGEGNEGMGMGWQEAFRCLVASGASILAMFLFSQSADDITGTAQCNLAVCGSHPGNRYPQFHFP